MRNLLLKTVLLFLFFLFSSSTPVISQAAGVDSVSMGIFDLLTNHEVTEITIQTDLDSLIKNKKTETYIEGLFTFERAKKQTMSLPVKIRCRGKFRRMKCSFPPLKLKFKKDDLSAHGLNKFNEIKLVTHCIDEKVASHDLILKEYLIYKLYNQLTSNSYRAQLVEVTYQGIGKKADKIKRMGILIEDAEDLAKRIGGQVYEKMGVSPDSLHSVQEKIASLFQFMIANLDWHYQMKRNVELIQLENGIVIPVPYDFDFSGIVMAPYARIMPQLGQKSLRDRIFQGNAKSVEEMQPAFRLFLSRRSKLLETVDQFDGLDLVQRDDIHMYLEEFFALISNPAEAEKALFENRGAKE